MTTHVLIDASGNVVAEFGSPQPDETPNYAVLQDDDPKVAAYRNPPPTEADYVAAVQAMLDTKARERNYDNIMSACTYAASTIAKFKAEGDACLAWRDAVWAQCYTDLAAVQAGTMAQPTVGDFVASLPHLTWPS
ncbi:MAG TPA: hypothetical protein VND94_01060 [Terriglobia bacterium]|nr:hypothetical protein [Terriglobia bacterium]